MHASIEFLWSIEGRGNNHMYKENSNWAQCERGDQQELSSERISVVAKTDLPWSSPRQDQRSTQVGFAIHKKFPNALSVQLAFQLQDPMLLQFLDISSCQSEIWTISVFFDTMNLVDF